MSELESRVAVLEAQMIELRAGIQEIRCDVKKLLVQTACTSGTVKSTTAWIAIIVAGVAAAISALSFIIKH